MKNKTLHRFGKMVKPYRKKIVLVTFLVLLINVSALLKPLLIKQVLDNYLPQKIYTFNNISITTIGIIYILLVLFENILDFINRQITNKMGENVVYDLIDK